MASRGNNRPVSHKAFKLEEVARYLKLAKGSVSVVKVACENYDNGVEDLAVGYVISSVKPSRGFHRRTQSC
jgi:hypothetical protein